MTSRQLEYPNLPANHYNNLNPKAAIRLYILNNMNEIINYYNTTGNIIILHSVYRRNFLSNESFYHSPHFPQIDMSAGGLMIHNDEKEYIKDRLTKFAQGETERDIESQLLLYIGEALRQTPNYNYERNIDVTSNQDKFILQMLIRYILKLKVLKIYDERIEEEGESEREREREREREDIERNMNNYLTENWISTVEHILRNNNNVSVVVPQFQSENVQNANGKKNKKILKKKSKKKKQKRSKKNKKSKNKRKHKKSKKKKQKKSH